MRSIDLLLDKAREKCERPSDRALAEKLRVTASAVSKWRKGGVITEMHATALAAIAGLDGEIVVRVMEEQAETPAQRRVWRSVLDRLSAAAAVLVLVVVAMPGVARAKSFEIKGMEAGNAAVCILCYEGICPCEPQPVQSWPQAVPLQATLPTRAEPGSTAPTFSPSMQAHRCRLDAPFKDGFGDAPG